MVRKGIKGDNMVKNLICENCSNFDCCAWFNKIKPFTDYARNPLPVLLNIEFCPKFTSNDNDENSVEDVE